MICAWCTQYRVIGRRQLTLLVYRIGWIHTSTSHSGRGFLVQNYGMRRISTLSHNYVKLVLVLVLVLVLLLITVEIVVMDGVLFSALSSSKFCGEGKIMVDLGFESHNLKLSQLVYCTYALSSLLSRVPEINPILIIGG